MGSNDPTILSRSSRGKERRSVRLRRIGLVSSVIAVVAVAAGVSLFGERLAGVLGLWHTPSSPPLASVVSTGAPSTSATIASGQIEVPDLSGMSVPQARALLGGAGLSVRVDVDAGLTPAAEPGVRFQAPAAHTIVSAGSVVILTVPRGAAVQTRAARPVKAHGTFLVVIDPGHQSKPDDTPEAIGPGSTVTVPRGTSGAVGVRTGAAEYELDRQLAVGLQRRLQAAGVKVVLTRTTNDVDLPGSQRAAAARPSKADLLVEIHLQSSAESSSAGAATRFGAGNAWTRPSANQSMRAADVIQRAVVEQTAAVDLGTTPCSDDPVLNWAGVPCVAVEGGFLSNPVEDRLLSGVRYQGLLCDGMADGIVAYLNSGR